MNFRELVGVGVAAANRKLPRLRYLIAAGALALLGHWLKEVEILAPLRALTAQLLHDLALMNPLQAVGAYYGHLYGGTACGVVLNAGGGGHVQCDLWAHMKHWGMSDWMENFILSPLVMIYAVGLQVWAEASLLGKIIYVLTLPLGLAGAARLTMAAGDDMWEGWTPVGWAMFAALAVPCIAFATLALQGWLIIVLWIFGQALAAIVWAVSVIAGPLAYARELQGVVKEARKMEKEDEGVRGA
jgi:hypothetical protein